MKGIKRTRLLVRTLVLGGLTLVGAYHFWHAPTGLRAQRVLRAENSYVQEKNEAIRREIASLNESIIALQTDPVATERVLREDLHMTFTNEYVYLLR